MEFKIYAIQDQKSGFLTPTFEPNDAVALRNFNHAVIATDGILHTHAQDFRLYNIGIFDSETAEIIPQVPSILIAEGKDMLEDV